MRRLLLLMGGGVVLFAVLYPLRLARRWPFDTWPTPVDTPLAEVRAEQDGVRVSGTAHYPVRILQRRPARTLIPAATWYLYPLFPTNDTVSREIRVLVASPVEPEEGVGFEDMTVTGLARPPRAVLGPDVEKAFVDAGYTFAADYVAVEAYPPGAKVRGAPEVPAPEAQ